MTFHKGFEFDYMARRPMYEVCPRWLIEHCKVGDQSVVVDLGCGSGIVTERLLARFAQSPEFRVLAIDPSEWELTLARQRIKDPRVTFFQGTAQEAASIVDTQVDAILLCNVLHQVPLDERESVLAGAFNLIRPGGLVGANTLFYSGGVDAKTQDFYYRWVAETRDCLHRAAVPWREAASTPIALERLTPQQHYELFDSCGYADITVEEVAVNWRIEDWEALSKYSVFIQGALWPEIDLEIGSDALIQGVNAAYEALGLETVRRGWLHCAARRPLN